MTMIKPFCGLRYNPRVAGELAGLIAPPFDVISPDRKARLHQRSPYNVAHVILPEPAPASGKKNKYARAAELFRGWIAAGALVPDPKPALYRYLTSFELKTADGIETRERPGFVALLRLSEYREGRVRPHERTLAGPKEDRFQLMLHARANLSQVFMLYSDPGREVDDWLGDAPPAKAATLRVEDDDGVSHALWPVTDARAVAAVTAWFEDKVVYIADGHHRYETALALRRHLLEKSPLFAGASDHVMVYFTPLEHPGLVIFPYHRVLHHLPQRRFAGLMKKLEERFTVERALVSPLEPGAPRRDFVREVRRRGETGPVFGMVDGPRGESFFLSLRPDARGREESQNELDLLLARLDVVILEELILADVLEIKRKDLLSEKHVAYETDYDRVFDAVHVEPNQLAFIMNPTRSQDVVAVSNLQGVMPEKSTYFFPKLATGLVFNDLGG